MFLNRLTFVDNNGSVKTLNHYDIGDDLEIDPNNDEYRNGLMVINAVEQPPQQQQPIPDVSNQSACVVCLIRPKTTMLVPCNHLKFCKECIDILSVPGEDEFGVPIVPKCPYCRDVHTAVVYPFMWYYF